jgi:uncharacterized protein YwgA
LKANKQAVSFFVKVYHPTPWICVNHDVQSEYVDNNKTQEKLVINLGDEDDNFEDVNFMTISRSPMRASAEWIEEMEKSVEDMEEEWNNGDLKRRIEWNFRI